MSDAVGDEQASELVYEPTDDAVMSTDTTLVPRISQPHGGAITPFDSERGAAAARRRWELKAEAIRRGVAKAGLQIDSIGKQDDLAVIEAIGENMALTAFDPSNKTAPAAARIVFDHGYPAPAKLEQQPTGNFIQLSDNAVAQIAAALAGRLDGDA